MTGHTSAGGRRPWPGACTGAVALTFDVDARSVMLAADPAYADRASLMSHQDYGPAVGVPRLLNVLGDYGLGATFFVPGATAEPAGYRAPWWEATPRTRPLLAEYGFTYDSSFFDADAPYAAQDCGGELVELPVCWALDDWERYAFWPDVTGDGRIDRPSSVVEAWWEEIQAIHAIGGLAVLTMHPFLSGRPSRASALRKLIERCLDSPDLWLTALDNVARWFRDRSVEKG